jgi:hypothetical protein
MRIPSFRPLLATFLLLCAGSVFAQDTAPAQAGPEQANATTATTTTTANANAEPTANTVPALDITWNCGKCEQNPKIVPLIIERYTAEAREAGYSVSSSETAKADIVDFRQRNPGLRIAFGVMGGKDRLQLRLMRDGGAIDIGDSSANIIQGQNALCADVARQLFRVMTGRSPKK